jgi:hypothetical protein
MTLRGDVVIVEFLFKMALGERTVRRLSSSAMRTIAGYGTPSLP